SGARRWAAPRAGASSGASRSTAMRSAWSRSMHAPCRRRARRRRAPDLRSGADRKARGEMRQVGRWDEHEIVDVACRAALTPGGQVRDVLMAVGVEALDRHQPAALVE